MWRIRPIQKAKQILRKELVKLLLSIPEEEKRRQSKIIREKLFSLPVFQKSVKISCYCSTINEVDTKPIVQRIFELNKKLYVPRYSYRYKKMYMERVQDMDDYNEMYKNKCVPRPQPKYADFREDAMDVGGLDLIIVNGLAFTKDGKRLGTGGGYYDSYIKEHRNRGFKKFKTIGLAFAEQTFNYLPTHIHDVTVDIVLYTSKKV